MTEKFLLLIVCLLTSFAHLYEYPAMTSSRLHSHTRDSVDAMGSYPPFALDKSRFDQVNVLFCTFRIAQRRAANVLGTFSTLSRYRRSHDALHINSEPFHAQKFYCIIIVSEKIGGMSNAVRKLQTRGSTACRNRQRGTVT